MSSEAENLEFSPTNIFIENNLPREKPLHKGYFILKKEISVILGTIVLILVIALSLAICSLTELKSLEKKVGEKLEDLNIKIESTIAENNLYNGFERVGKYGYFLKLEGKKEDKVPGFPSKKMNYSEGQKACSKLYGHILEIPDHSLEEYKSKYYHYQLSRK